MKKMTVGMKISVGFAVVIAMTVILGVLSLITAHRMAAYQEATVSDAMPGVYTMGQVRTMAKDMRGRMLMHVASSDPQEMAGFESDIARLHDQAMNALKEYEKTIFRPADREGFNKIAPALEQYISTWQPVQPLSRAGKTADALAAFRQSVWPAFDKFDKAVADEIDLNKSYGDECTVGSRSAASMANWSIWIGLALAIALGCGFAFAIVRGVNGALRRSANDLSEGAAQIASAAAQVASSSQALAQGSSQQAASLEETSASTEEITSMTRKNAEHSKEAADLMANVDHHVKEGNRTLDQMVVSMQEINASSDKISKINKVIDEIAFQTNILALNAAVEAARAGEAGMGFAVVADEVRNLAQRSAQAAKDTAALIEESIAKSAEGSTRLQQVADVIRAITDSSVQVKTLVDDVNAGSQEQARGIEQIARAVADMDKVTQSAAATAEESASASEELSAQAQAMNDVVRRLQTLVGTAG